jgi:cell pole-organizing protein PopZ
MQQIPPSPLQSQFEPSNTERSFDLHTSSYQVNSGQQADTGSNASLEEMVEKQVREQVDQIVQNAVKAQLEQMARKALPEIAERVVKAEIRRLLEGLSESKD